MALGLFTKSPKPGDPVTINRKGGVDLPAMMLQRFGLEPGAAVIIEETERGILVRPAARASWETFSNARKAEFLFHAAAGEQDRFQAVAEITKMGIDLAEIPGAMTGVPEDALSNPPHQMGQQAEAA